MIYGFRVRWVVEFLTREDQNRLDFIGIEIDKAFFCTLKTGIPYGTYKKWV